MYVIQNIQETIWKDHHLQKLKEHIIEGWPSKQNKYVKK